MWCNENVTHTCIKAKTKNTKNLSNYYSAYMSHAITLHAGGYQNKISSQSNNLT